MFVLKAVVLVAVLAVGLCQRLSAQPQPQNQRQGNEAAPLPDGSELVLRQAYRPGFSCSGYNYGYYADPDNDCQVFHICVPVPTEDGNTETLQYSFFCGNTTLFNQETLTCDHEERVDCSQAANFYSVNDLFGVTEPQDSVRQPQPGPQPGQQQPRPQFGQQPRPQQPGPQFGQQPGPQQPGPQFGEQPEPQQPGPQQPGPQFGPQPGPQRPRPQQPQRGRRSAPLPLVWRH